MTIYTNAIATVTRQLADKGQLGDIRRTTVTGGGPADPTGGTATVTDYPAQMIVFPVSQKDADGTFIKAGDFHVIVGTDGLTITPKTTDLIVCSEGVLSIVDAGKFSPAGVTTHYDMIARRVGSGAL